MPSDDGRYRLAGLSRVATDRKVRPGSRCIRRTDTSLIHGGRSPAPRRSSARQPRRSLQASDEALPSDFPIRDTAPAVAGHPRRPRSERHRARQGRSAGGASGAGRRCRGRITGPRVPTRCVAAALLLRQPGRAAGVTGHASAMEDNRHLLPYWAPFALAVSRSRPLPALRGHPTDGSAPSDRGIDSWRLCLYFPDTESEATWRP